MKAEAELRAAINDAMAIFEDGVGKVYVAEKVANLVAALEVFTDLNYDEGEQSKLFDVAGVRVAELRGKLG
jgi:hypothetical protein